MRKLRAAAVSFIVGALLALPAMADTSSPSKLPPPGTLNYVEGQASMGGESLNSKSVGSAELRPGETLTSHNGKAEILLTPGVFLRTGDNSSVKMISPSLSNTEVEVQRGEAQVEVDQVYKQNKLLVKEDGATTQLQKRGLYDFNADQNLVRVLKGQAWLQDGDRRIKIKGSHEVALNAPELKSVKFNKKNFETSDDLYRWSRLRSEYVAEANLEEAPSYILGSGYGPGWWGAGWYWDPFFNCYTFIPGNGIFYSPFGWGFYSPLWAPYYWTPGYYGRVYYPHVGPLSRPAVRNPGVRNNAPFHGGLHPGPEGGFHGWGGPHASGGFHGGEAHAGSGGFGAAPGGFGRR
jgi:hypothetical protein